MALPDYIPEYTEDLTSGVLPIICEVINQGRGCNVVDLGAASTDNCMVFSRNGARVYIDTSSNSLRSKVIETNELESSDIDELLTYCPNDIDVLLFWDLLDYLSLETIALFMQRLTPVMRRGALLYGMVSQQYRIPASPAVIDLVSEDRLRFHYGALEREGSHFAPKQLEGKMPGFCIEKLYLMQNGVQEHLFVYEGAAD